MVEESEGVLRTYGAVDKHRDRILNGPIIRTIFWLGLPPLLNQLIIVAYNIADAYWLSQYSEILVAVPRQVWPVMYLFHSAMNALNAACLTMIAQYVGAKAYDKASLEASRFFTLSFIVGGILGLTIFVFRNLIFMWIVATPPEIFEEVMAYSGIIALDIFLNYVAVIYTTILQSLGDTRKPAIVNVFAVTANITLDPFMVLGIGGFPRLGVLGAALTDVFGKIISITALSYILRKHYQAIRINFTGNMNFKWLRIILQVTLPILAMGVTNGFAFIIQLRLVNIMGVAVAAAFSIGFIVIDTVNSALWGLSGAPAIMIGQNLGAGNSERAKEIALKGATVIFSIVALTAAALYPIRAWIADVFADDPMIIRETILFLDVLLPALPFFALFISAMSAGRGSGRTLFPTILDIVRLWIFRLGLGYVLAFPVGLGPFGIWLAISISHIIGGIAAILWLKYGSWAKAIIKS